MVADVDLQTISLFVNQLVEHRLLFVDFVQNPFRIYLLEFSISYRNLATQSGLLRSFMISFSDSFSGRLTFLFLFTLILLALLPVLFKFLQILEGVESGEPPPTVKQPNFSQIQLVPLLMQVALNLNKFLLVDLVGSNQISNLFPLDFQQVNHVFKIDTAL